MSKKRAHAIALHNSFSGSIYRLATTKFILGARKANLLFVAGLAVLLLAAFFLPSLPCAMAERTTRYQLTIEVNKSAGGSVSTGGGTYTAGTTVDVTEKPNSGFVFAGWYLNGAFSGTAETFSVVMYTDTTLEARFIDKLPTLAIVVSPANGGTTSPAPDVWTYQYGDSIVVEEHPNIGYKFAGWYVDGVYATSDSNLTVVMDTEHTVDALFNLEEGSRLTISSTNGGSTSLMGVQLFTVGSNVSVSASPSQGYAFNCWIVDNLTSVITNPITLVMNDNHELQAIFIQETLETQTPEPTAPRSNLPFGIDLFTATLLVLVVILGVSTTLITIILRRRRKTQKSLV
jgi:hypothetical protein